MERNLYWVINDEDEGLGQWVVALSRGEAKRMATVELDQYLRVGEAIENRNDVKGIYELDYSESYALSDELAWKLGMILYRGTCKKCDTDTEIDYYTELCDECAGDSNRQM